MKQETNIDWNNLGFNYIKTDFRYISTWKNGAWDEGHLTEDNMLSISEASTALHYGQQCFEGLKAYRTKDGSIQLFRPNENSKRINNSLKKLLMPEISEEKFINACIDVVKANERFVPPYGTGATLYLRPFVIGVGHNIGVKPAPEYLFGIFCVPVGAYFKEGLKPVNFMISDYDRAAPRGTGSAKVGGNYAASMQAHEIALKRGFADCIYLDPATNTKIEEVGAANFFGITKNERNKGYMKQALYILNHKLIGNTMEQEEPLKDYEKILTSANVLAINEENNPTVTHLLTNNSYYINKQIYHLGFKERKKLLIKQ